MPLDARALWMYCDADLRLRRSMAGRWKRWLLQRWLAGVDNGASNGVVVGGSRAKQWVGRLMARGTLCSFGLSTRQQLDGAVGAALAMSNCRVCDGCACR